MNIDLHKWEYGLERGAKDSLTFLRRLRDTLAEELLAELHYLVGNWDDDHGHDVDGTMERLLTGQFPDWAATWLEKRFQEHNNFLPHGCYTAQGSNIEKLEVLLRIAVRIGELERREFANRYAAHARAYTFAT